MSLLSQIMTQEQMLEEQRRKNHLATRESLQQDVNVQKQIIAQVEQQLINAFGSVQAAIADAASPRAIAYQEHLDKLAEINAALRWENAQIQQIEHDQNLHAISLQKEAQTRREIKDFLDKENSALAAHRQTLFEIQNIQADFNAGRIDDLEAAQKTASAYTSEVNSLKKLQEAMLAIDKTKLSSQAVDYVVIDGNIIDVGIQSAEEYDRVLAEINQKLAQSIELEQQKKQAVHDIEEARKNEAALKRVIYSLDEQQWQLEIAQLENAGKKEEAWEKEKAFAVWKLSKTDDYIRAAGKQAEMEASLIALMEAQRNETRNQVRENTLLVDQQREIDLLTAKRAKNDAEIRRIELEILEINLKQSDAWKELSGPDQDKAIENLKTIYDLQNKNTKGVKDYASATLSHLSGALSAASDLMTAKLEQGAEDRKRILDQQLKIDLKRNEDYYKDELEKIDGALQAKLYAMGYIDAATEEQHERELQKAIESGDHRNIFEAQSALERFKIEEDFKNRREAMEDEAAEAKKKLEMDAAEAKAKIDYGLAMARWKAEIAQGVISVAQAILTGYAQLGPFAGPAGAAIMGAVAGVQLGAIYANQPKYYPPAFDSGGIVPGSSFRGDNMWTRQNSGEMDLNLRQQKNLFNAIDNNELGGGNITVVVYTTLDGAVVAKNTVERINSRQCLIRRGSVV
jgi:hypothetical protein